MIFFGDCCCHLFCSPFGKGSLSTPALIRCRNALLLFCWMRIEGKYFQLYNAYLMIQKHTFNLFIHGKVGKFINLHDQTPFQLDKFEWMSLLGLRKDGERWHFGKLIYWIQRLFATVVCNLGKKQKEQNRTDVCGVIRAIIFIAIDSKWCPNH